MKSTLLYDRVEGLGDFRDLRAVLDQDARLQLIAHDDWGRRRDAFAFAREQALSATASCAGSCRGPCKPPKPLRDADAALVGRQAPRCDRNNIGSRELFQPKCSHMPGAPNDGERGSLFRLTAAKDRSWRPPPVAGPTGKGQQRVGMIRHRPSAPVQVFGRRHDERRLALSRPASKKRQGTKSREVGQRLGSERYGDLRLAPSSLVGVTLGRRDLHACTQGRARE